MLGAGQSRYDRLGHELMCSCGCGQILLECNHVGCPDSARMINELQAQIATGNSDNADPELVCGEVWRHRSGRAHPRRLRRCGVDRADCGLSCWLPPGRLWWCGCGSAGRCGWPAGNGGVDSARCRGVPKIPQDAALRERIRRETEY